MKTHCIFKDTPRNRRKQAIHSNKLSFVPLPYSIMENNLPLVLKSPREEKQKWEKKKKSYIQNSSAIVCGVLFTPPFSKQPGALDAYMPRNSGIMKRHERKRRRGIKLCLSGCVYAPLCERAGEECVFE